jgi:two-component system chemotaxis response regulator CheY
MVKPGVMLDSGTQFGWVRNRDVEPFAKSSACGTVLRHLPINCLFNERRYCLRAGTGNFDRSAGCASCVGGFKMAVDLSMSVLVVDDYSTMIRIIRNLLKQIGFENIDDANDGSTALAKMRAKKYGLVISDWNMEPMTGYDLLLKVRADPALSTTPFIMITAESKIENVIAAKEAGVNNYIVKPFNAVTLKAKIDAVFPEMAMA